jgi:predicted secreted protein
MIIQGRNILIYIQNDSGEFVATACDKTCTLHIETEFLEITDPNGGTTRRRLPTITDWSITGSGLIDYNREISALFMQQKLIGQVQIQVKMFAQNGDGYAVYSGAGYFQSIDETGDVTAAGAYSYTIVADGDLTIESTIPQNSEEGKLLSVLMNEDNDLITDNNNDLIIV